MCWLVFLAKYPRVVSDSHVNEFLKAMCLEIESRHQRKFMEIGAGRDHAHFLIHSVSTYSVTKIVTLPKSLTARGIIKRCARGKKNTPTPGTGFLIAGGRKRHTSIFAGLGYRLMSGVWSRGLTYGGFCGARCGTGQWMNLTLGCHCVFNDSIKPCIRSRTRKSGQL